MSCDIAVFFSTNLYNNKPLFTSFANELIKQFDLIVSLSATDLLNEVIANQDLIEYSEYDTETPIERKCPFLL